MHKFLRSVGFSKYEKDKDIERLLRKLLNSVSDRKLVEMDEDRTFCELRVEVASDMGVIICGYLDKKERFHRQYYIPYLLSDDVSSDAECTIQRHTDRETYAGLVDEFRVGISLIFYINNSLACRERIFKKEPMEVEGVYLSGLSTKGKILFPIKKTEQQKIHSKVVSKDRNTLLEAARNGDEDAMETLTIEDIDMYSKVSRRIMKEDIYTIIDSCFMPCGVECDQYSVIGEIMKVGRKENQFTKEEVYDLMVDCNDVVFHIGIAKCDLIGEPEVGRRFKGQIWMQGGVKFRS